jgi:catechol 2,3-dioxygenase-like lactoylglutathione lyase family enzyme
MKTNPVGWFEIYVKDLTRARAFYEAVLAVKLTALESPDASVGTMWAFPMEQNATGAAGALASMQGGQSTGPSEKEKSNETAMDALALAYGKRRTCFRNDKDGLRSLSRF